MGTGDRRRVTGDGGGVGGMVVGGAGRGAGTRPCPRCGRVPWAPPPWGVVGGGGGGGGGWGGEGRGGERGGLAWWWVVLRHGHATARRVRFPLPLPPPPWVLVWVGDGRRGTSDGAVGVVVGGVATRPRRRRRCG